MCTLLPLHNTCSIRVRDLRHVPQVAERVEDAPAEEEAPEEEEKADIKVTRANGCVLMSVH